MQIHLKSIKSGSWGRNVFQPDSDKPRDCKRYAPAMLNYTASDTTGPALSTDYGIIDSRASYFSYNRLAFRHSSINLEAWKNPRNS